MGYSFRTRMQPVEHGNISVIQMKDLTDENTVDCSKLTKTNMDIVKEHIITKKEDLIFRSRGLLTTSAILQDEVKNAVIAAPLLRIRIINPDLILPAYLNWFISQPAAQLCLTRMARGSTQKMISKRSLEELDVLIPEMTTQKAIVELVELKAQETQLLDIITRKRNQFMSATLMNLAKEQNV